MSNVSGLKRPYVFNYIDLQLFLRDIYAFRKKSEKNFSYESWAQELGLRSRSFLRLVITGRRNLTDQVFPLFAASLNLLPNELDYLSLLFRYSTATDRLLKESYGRQLIGKWNSHLEQVQIENVSEFLKDPSIPIVFTYFTKAKVSSDVRVIAHLLNLSKERVLLAIQALTYLRLLIPEMNDMQEICYRTAGPYFNVPNMPNNDFVKNFHFEGFRLAEQAHDLPFDQRKFRSLVLTMNEQQMKTAQQMISDFTRTVLSSLATATPSASAIEEDTSHGSKSKIYRLNLQLFPVSEEI